MAEDYRGRYLSAGARVAVIAPASPFDPPDFERGVERLRERYEVRVDPSVLARKGFFAGDDQRRLSELQAAIDDPAVDGIIAARGGYGVTRLLSKLKLSALNTRPKLVVGFSDITALHALWARHRVLSIHATMVAALGRVDMGLSGRHWRALEGQFVELHSGLTTVVPGETEGVLLGGNLTVLTALLATPHALPVEGAVLFFEDIGERPYRIDRMLTTWRDAGAFAAVRGIVLGAFTQCDPGLDGVSAPDVLIERLSDLGIPVVLGLPAGHIDDNSELPFGRRVQLDATRGELQLLPRRVA
ncbi:MAG TPA: LD-carboxypeptidase [Polyangiales bacterium]|nr:LD-carboxypeptidase [Polyangiales bacterium]